MNALNCNRTARTLAAILFAVPFVFAAPLFSEAEAVPPTPDVWLTELETWQSLWVGAVIGGREVGSLEVLMRGDHFLIPLQPFARIARCEVALQDDGSTRIDTPMGDVAIPPEDLRVLNGATFVTQRFLERDLITQVIFDNSEYAVRFLVPWSLRAGTSNASREGLVADVTPPGASLATIRADSRYSARESGPDELRQSAILAGRVAGGRWRVRLEDQGGDARLREYAWLRSADNHLLFAGRQRVGLHPLLRGFEMTGVQAAWTNEPMELFGDALEPGEIVPRRLQPVSSFRGEGPPAGVAELRIEDVVVARQTIGLDGLYEFLDVLLPARRLNQVAVYVYERRNLQVPVEIHDRSRSGSEFLLRDGAQIHLGGAGHSENPLDSSFVSADDDWNAFYQWRYGLTSDVTLEAAAQHTPDGTRTMAGAVARVGRGSLLSVAAGRSDDGWGYDAHYDGRWQRWRVLARSQFLGAGFDVFPGLDDDANLDDSFGESWDHFFEVGYRSGPRFDLALIGRSRQAVGAAESVDYLLPALSWRPTIRTAVRARPDLNGDYRFDLSHRFNDAWRLGVSYQNRAFLDLDYRLSTRSQLSFSAEVGDRSIGGIDVADRYALTWTSSGLGPRRLSLTAGALWSDDEVGYRLGAYGKLLPGVLLRAEIIDDPRIDASGERRGPQAQIGLSADLALARGRVLPARSVASKSSRGAISGRVVIDAPAGFKAPEIRGVRILVDGMPATATLGGGSFFIGNLEKAVYQVEIDPEMLPIELSPQSLTINAEVLPSAVTRVDFVVRPEYGLAGRVRDTAGEPLPNLLVALRPLDDDEQPQTARSDAFGLFRFDGLPIGDYLLHLPELSAAGRSAERVVQIRDDFLFGQDLVVARTALDKRALKESP